MAYFDAISDGNNIMKTKPDLEVFLKVAEMFGIKSFRVHRHGGCKVRNESREDGRNG